VCSGVTRCWPRADVAGSRSDPRDQAATKVSSPPVTSTVPLSEKAKQLTA
jgi:hypothetical protein